MLDNNTIIAVGAGLFAFGVAIFLIAIIAMGLKALKQKFNGFSSYEQERVENRREVAELREKVKSLSAIAKQAEAV